MIPIQSYLTIQKGCGSVDLHPDKYYTSKPEEILRDVRDLIVNAKALRLGSCRLIVGKGNAWQPGVPGTLMGYILSLIKNGQLRNRIKSHQLEQENAVLFLEFTWPFGSDSKKQQRNLQKEADIQQRKRDSQIEKTNRVRLLDAKNNLTTNKLKKYYQKTKSILGDYYPECPKSNDPTDHLICFLNDPERLPASILPDFERLLWQAWYQDTMSQPDLDSKCQQMDSVFSIHPKFQDFTPQLVLVSTEDDLKDIFRQMLPYLPANVWRV